MISTRSGNKRPRHHRWLFALPEGRMPAQITCGGNTFQHLETFKHDFFAATGLYQDGERQVVVKMGRRTGFLFFPLAFIGRLFTLREVRIYRAAETLAGVPRLVGRADELTFVHEFVPGHPLGRDERVDDEFFDRLALLLSALHARGIAYVDLNKRQNILVGEDGRPYLIDFQISLYLPRNGWGAFPPARWLLQLFQRADRYHFCKHKRRLRPDLLTPDERATAERLSPWIRAHRLIARPFTQARRRALREIWKSQEVAVVGANQK